MAASISRSLLRCPTCERLYAVAEVDEDTSYVCLRCRVPVAGPTGRAAGTVFLYGGDREAGVAPAPGARGDVAAEQTWSGDTDDVEDVDDADLGTVGRYDLLEELGRGGMGVVYRAWDADLGRGVAIKLLLAGGRAGQSQVERFLREARAGAQLDHPNLVRVHDIGRHDGQVFFTMDLVPGPSLAEVLDEVGHLPPREAARIVASAARGVHHAHVAGLLHRDLKPGNILLEATGRALVTDFGLVKSLTGDDATLTRTGQVLGTPAYMAPEQAGGGDASRASDVYALGAVLYRALSGRPPYEGLGVATVIVQLAREAPPPLASLGVPIPADLALVCNVAMAREPERRYPTALALAEDLERWLRAEPVEARPPSWTYRFGAAMRRHPTATAVSRVLFALGVVGIFGWVAMDVRARWQGQARAVEAEAALDLLLMDLDRDGLDRFTSVAAYQDTPAIARAWTAWADHGRAQGDPAGELDGLTRAWRAAKDDQILASGLGLARALRARWRFEDLDVALSTLVSRVPAAADHEEVRALQLEAALGRGAMATALERSVGTPHEALIRSIAPVLHTGIPGLPRAIADFDGDGAPELLVQHEGKLTRHALADDLRPLATAPAPPGWRTYQPVPWPGGDLLLQSDFTGGRQTERQILRWTSDAPQVAYHWVEGNLRSSAAADLDLDGSPELYIGTGMGSRRLLQLREAGGTWSVLDAHPPTSALNSNLEDLVVADLIPGGPPELVVAASGWGAWDVRVLQNGAEGLERIARYRVGETVGHALAVVEGADGPRIAVAKARRFPSRVAFPPEDRFGAPSGVYLLRWSDGGLVLDGSVRLDGPVDGERYSPTALRVADLDGDGLQDLLVAGSVKNHESSATLLHQAADGSFAPLPLDSRAGLPVELDGDPGAELIVARDGEIVVLGAGTLEAEPRRGTVQLRPPPSLPASLHELWSRGSELVSMGLLVEAAAAFRDLARLCEAPASGDAWARAGALEAEAGDLEGASRAWLAAASSGYDAGTALREALEAQLRDHRFDRAAETAERLRGVQPLPPDAAELLDRSAEAMRRTTTFDLTAPLDERWRIRAPLQLSQERTRGLSAHLIQDVRPDVLERTLQLTPGRLGLSVVLDVDRAEWGGGWVVGLRAEDGTELGVGQHSIGGGGLLEHQLGCFVEGFGDPIQQARHPVPSADTPLSLELTVDWLPEQAEMRCTTSVDGVVLDRSSGRTAGPMPGHQVTLFLASRGESPSGSGAHVRVRRIDVMGAVDTDAPAPTPFEAGALAWVNGATTVAMEAWTETSTEEEAAPIARAFALDRRGETGAARALLREHIADPYLLGAMRSDPRRTLALLTGIDADVAIDAFAAAWQIAVGAHDEEGWVAPLFEGLPGLTPPRTPTRQALLLARGTSTLAAGSTRAGLEDLETLADFEDGDRRLRREALLAITLFRAESSDLPGALEAARRAIALAPAPEVIRDQLRQRPELRPLLDRPEWKEILTDGPELWVDGTERRWP